MKGEKMVECKFCGSEDVVKAGIYYAGKRKQRWLCKSCGRVFLGPLTPELEFERIAKILEKHGAKSAALFGSSARGEAKPGSDVDVLVDFSGRKSLLELARIERELSETLGVRVDLLTEKSVSPYLIHEIKKEAKAIC
jgi:predicted nucleotidyltransferase